MSDRPVPTDVRMRGFRSRTDVEAVWSWIDAFPAPLEGEAIATTAAAGRVLAQAVDSPVDVPAFARAAMDGWAHRGEETFGARADDPLTFDVIGVSLPGAPCAQPVGPGQAARIMTGAPVPTGADAVLRAEDGHEEGGRLEAHASVPPGRHIGQSGEDVEAGTRVLEAGRRLRPQDVGLAASIGCATLSVVRRPKVSIVVTGDELVPAGTPPEGPRIVDSNTPMLEALVRRDGGAISANTRVRDDRALVADALDSAGGDILLVSGGSSVGQEDHAPAVVAERGYLDIHGVALRPASPTGMGRLGGRPVFLLPGNPVSCLCAYDLFAGRLVRRLAGRHGAWPYPSADLTLRRKVSSVLGRVDYVRVRRVEGGVEPIMSRGASILSSTTRADGFVLVPRDSEGWPEGESVEVFLYDVL